MKLCIGPTATPQLPQISTVRILPQITAIACNYGLLLNIGVAGQSCNQSIRTAQAARPQKVHQKEEKGSAAEAAACKFGGHPTIESSRASHQHRPQHTNAQVQKLEGKRKSIRVQPGGTVQGIGGKGGGSIITSTSLYTSHIGLHQTQTNVVQA